MIQILIAEVTINETDEWGIDMEFSNIGGRDWTLGSLAAGAGVATALGVPNLTVSSADINIVIRALKEQGKLEVLSEPKLTVNNNETANMQVGQNIAVVEGVDRFTDGSSAAIVARRDVGIILEVTPSISSDGFVRLQIAPEISTVSAQTDQISEEVFAPRIDQRVVDTVVTVKDGQTVVIGGLIQTQQSSTQSKVPGLGDIPGLGALFRSYDTRDTKTELLVILTPRVIPGGIREGERLMNALTDKEIDAVSSANELRYNSEQFKSIGADGETPPPDREDDAPMSLPPDVEDIR
jgi:general secretion pathway protein D